MLTYHSVSVGGTVMRVYLWKKLAGGKIRLELVSLQQQRKYIWEHVPATARDEYDVCHFLESFLKACFQYKPASDYKYILPEQAAQVNDPQVGNKVYNAAMYLAMLWGTKWLTFKPVTVDMEMENHLEAMVQWNKLHTLEMSTVQNEVALLRQKNSTMQQIQDEQATKFTTEVAPLKQQLEQAVALIDILQTQVHSPVAGFPESGILNASLQKKLNLLYGNTLQQWKRLYHATSGLPFSAAAFHAACDNKCNLMVVIQSTSGHIFGGLTPVAMNGTNGSYNRTECSFLFGLRTHAAGDNPVRLQVTVPSQAIYCHSTYGPSFGSGCDLCAFNFTTNMYRCC